METQSPKCTAEGLDKYINWDKEDVQDRSCTPSPTAVIDKPMQGEAVEETLPARQNRCLVSERVIEPRAVLPREHTPVVEEEKTPQDESIPADKEQTNLMAEDEIVKLFAKMEEF